jgi:putative transposase
MPQPRRRKAYEGRWCRVDQLERLKLLHGLVPERIQRDNGSEFISKEVDRWAYENSVTLDFSRPGKPTDNPYVESSNGKFRDECLLVNWFLSLDDAKEKINSWKDDYNFFRPHSSLDDLSTKEFIIIHTKTLFLTCPKNWEEVTFYSKNIKVKHSWVLFCVIKRNVWTIPETSCRLH